MFYIGGWASANYRIYLKQHITKRARIAIYASPSFHAASHGMPHPSIGWNFTLDAVPWWHGVSSLLLFTVQFPISGHLWLALSKNILLQFNLYSESTTYVFTVWLWPNFLPFTLGCILERERGIITFWSVTFKFCRYLWFHLLCFLIPKNASKITMCTSSCFKGDSHRLAIHHGFLCSPIFGVLSAHSLSEESQVFLLRAKQMCKDCPERSECAH